ncbi:hypothetical protein [Streptomyces sp. NPDC053048]|uniref:hypothetical protein n=1 Tax=Streptomyces sp. NPDC053048 TaxID=3365694 RepID=UPI0037D36617
MTLLLTFVTPVAGELAPKRLAMQFAPPGSFPVHDLPDLGIDLGELADTGHYTTLADA